MKKVTVSGVEFTLLEPSEIGCEHGGEWQPVYEETIVNPNGEFVEGYGCNSVSVRVEVGQQCPWCGYIEKAGLSHD